MGYSQEADASNVVFEMNIIVASNYKIIVVIIDNYTGKQVPTLMYQMQVNIFK